MTLVAAVDAGTTGVRTFAVDTAGVPHHHAYREFTQYFPRPGWVEHDAGEILDATLATLADVAAWAEGAGETIAAIGITNQRETVVSWDRRTGEAKHRAIVWQDRRTATRCDALRSDGHEASIRRTTGLVLDPYFSATKIEWLLGPGGLRAEPNLCFGTVDSWLCWNLTGGTEGGVFATEPSNASRTMLFDLAAGGWSSELCALFGVPPTSLAEIRPSCGSFGITTPAGAAGLAVPIGGIAGDQQAALMGQACLTRGMAKNTYGTGSFVLVNVGAELPKPADGLLTTVAWDLGDGPVYAMEGSIFVTGAAVQWLRDGIQIIDDASETEALASEVADTGGVVLVPAFTGLGSPWWDPYARGAIVGITRGTGRAHLARAVVESMAHQTRDVVDAITGASGTTPSELRVDGGASVMDLLCQYQADLLGLTVRRPLIRETTALGAAYLAGLAQGIWDSPAAVSEAWQEEAAFTPSMSEAVRDERHAQWLRAVDRSRGWAQPE